METVFISENQIKLGDSFCMEFKSFNEALEHVFNSFESLTEFDKKRVESWTIYELEIDEDSENFNIYEDAIETTVVISNGINKFKLD